MFSDNKLKTLTLNYFEKGHTFMSVDSFHHLVEEHIRKKKYLYDFNDYVDCVEKSGIAIKMQASDFFDLWKMVFSYYIHKLQIYTTK